MGNTLFQAICRMGIFMICAQAVVHFRPKESYEKYLKLLVSVIVLIQVFLPIGSFLLGEGRQNAAKALEQFGRELEQGLEDAAGDAAAADELLEQMTLEEVMRRLEEQEGEGAESLPEGVQGGSQGQQDTQKDSQGSDFPGEDGVPEEGAQGGNPGQQEEQAGGAGADRRIEIDSDAIEPVTIEPIGPVQGGGAQGQ